MVGRPSKKEQTPPAADKRWAGWSRPVLEHLAKPRTWEDLFAWAEGADMGPNRLRNCVCWLELHHLILEGRNEADKVIWRQCSWLLALGDELPDVLDGHVAKDGREAGA